MINFTIGLVLGFFAGRYYQKHKNLQAQGEAIEQKVKDLVSQKLAELNK